MNANDTTGRDEGFDDFAHAAGAALRRPAPDNGLAGIRSARQRRRVVRVTAGAGAVVIVLAAGAVLLSEHQDNSQRLTPADVTLPATTDFSTSTSTPPTSLAPESAPETTELTDGPPLTPEAVRQSLVAAAESEGFGTAASKFTPLCGFGWDSCTISEIRTRDDSVVLTVQIEADPEPDAFSDETVAEITGRSAFGILGDQFPQLDYIQVTNTAGLVLADVRCYYAFPPILRCP